MRIAPIAVSLAIIVVVTTTLLYVKDTQHDVQHLVFFYLIPNAFVAIVYGSVLSMVCAILATLAATYFLYDPPYSFYVSDPREVGELIIFAGLGLLGAKCISLRKRPLAESLEPINPPAENDRANEAPDKHVDPSMFQRAPSNNAEHSAS